MKTTVGALLVAAALLVGGAASANAALWGKCQSCHGANGKGNPGMVKGLGVAAEALDVTKAGTKGKADAALIGIVTNGQGKMPAYKGKMSDADIAAVVKYMKSL